MKMNYLQKSIIEKELKSLEAIREQKVSDLKKAEEMVILRERNLESIDLRIKKLKEGLE